MKKRVMKLAIFGVIAGIFLAMSPGPALAAADTASVPFVTASNVRLRTGPSLEAEIVKIVSQGSTVGVTNFRDGEWFAVTVNGSSGYMFAEHLFASFVTASNVRLRTGPSLEAGIIRTVSQGSAVRVTDFRNGEWFAVEVGSDGGYMFAEHLFAPFNTTANVRLRTGPSLEAGVVKTVSQGSVVEVTDFRNGEWFAVRYNGSSGYMFAEHLAAGAAGGSPGVGSGGVELLDWAYVQTILRTGVSVQVTDVRSGITYWIRSFSHGRHADVEPVTADDTAAMLRAFGRWTWTPRPVWVHIDGRTVAASINGMPHAGSTISGNNMNGHVCLHFYGSRTHNGSTRHERDHQNAVQEAFRAGN